MLDIGSKRCGHKGCTTQPSYGVEGGRRAEFCPRQAKDGIINTRSKTYGHLGSKWLSYGVEGRKTAKFRAQHANDRMIIKKCIHAGCTKQRSYGVEGREYAEICAQEAKRRMIDIHSKGCRHAGCTIWQSHCCVEGGKEVAVCAKHAKDGEINFYKRCRHAGVLEAGVLRC